MTAIPLVPAHRRLDLARLILVECGFAAPPPRFVSRTEGLRDALSRRMIDMYYTTIYLERWTCGEADVLLYSFRPELYRCDTFGVRVVFRAAPDVVARLAVGGHGLLCEAWVEFTGSHWHELHHSRTSALAARLASEIPEPPLRSLDAEGPTLAVGLERLRQCPDEVVLGEPELQAPEHNRFRVGAIARWLAAELGLPGEGVGELDRYAATVTADLVRVDAERGEELLRMLLAARGMRPAGETLQVAEKKLTELDSAADFAHARACWASETPEERGEELIGDADWLFRR